MPAGQHFRTVLDYVQGLLAASRHQGLFVHGLSPRAGMSLVSAAQAYAKIDNRTFVRPMTFKQCYPLL